MRGCWWYSLKVVFLFFNREIEKMTLGRLQAKVGKITFSMNV